MSEKRFLNETPVEEMQARWIATLNAMKQKDIDVLAVFAYTKQLPVCAKWLTDIQTQEYPIFFLFGEEGISAYYNGPVGAPGFEEYIAHKNIADNIAVKTLPTSSNDVTIMPKEIVKTLKKYGHKRIGITNYDNMPLSVYLYVKDHYPEIEWVDFSQEMDSLFAVKSSWELEQLHKCCALHDKLMAAAVAVCRVGRTEGEIINDLADLANGMGCVALNFLTGSGPQLKGGPVQFFYANRRIQEGDIMRLLIEVAVPGGFWGELGRTIVFGKPEAWLVKQHEAQLKFQDYYAKNFVPGADVREVFHGLNKLKESMGYPPERRFASHGQGYNIVERPFVSSTEPMTIKENMFMAIHPTAVGQNGGSENCDNYFITKDGAIRGNKFSQDLIVIDDNFEYAL